MSIDDVHDEEAASSSENTVAALPGLKLRLLGTPRPGLDFALGVLMLAFGVAGLVLAGGKTAGWVVLGGGVLAAAYFTAIGLWSRRHREELARYWNARRTRLRASMRRHPLRWLVGLPIAAGVDAGLRWNVAGQRSAASTAAAVAVGAATVLAVVTIAIRRGRRG